MEGSELIPVTAGGQEVAYRGGDGNGIRGSCLAGGVIRGGVQVHPLGFQPGACRPQGGHVGGLGRRPDGRRAAGGGALTPEPKWRPAARAVCR